MATALYRRYRPETFSEMIGQAHVTDPLMTALRSERVGHAYLFSGPRGCGKTTSARVLARCLNCAQGPTDTPCGTCPSCIDLSRDGGGSLDVVEIDAASHGGVDDARDLRERAVFAPARDRYKIFIIDEAHMVTPAGFNALLKIVEEPPPHVKFIFATTEPEKVIGTIRSRTHHYPFRLIAPAALIDYAQQLCTSEGITVEDGVLQLVVRAGGGSVRDTLSILDQLIAGSEGTLVTTARAAGLLGFTSTELIDEVVTALAAADAAVAFAAIDRVVQTGQDPRRFVEDLLERLRDLIVISATSVDGAAAVFRGVPEAQLNRMFQQSLAFPRGELSRLADLVSAALDTMAGATAPRLQLELLIARALVGAPGSVSASGSASSNDAAGRGSAATAPVAQHTPNGAAPHHAAATPTAAPVGGFAAQLSAARAAAAHDAPNAATAALASAASAAPATSAAPAPQNAPQRAPQNAPQPPAAEPVHATPAAPMAPAAQPSAPAAPVAVPPVQPAQAPAGAPQHSGLTPPPMNEAPVYAPGQSPADFVNAMRSARDFLKNDQAGTAQATSTAPQPAPAPAPAPAVQAPQAPAEPTAPAASAPAAPQATPVAPQIPPAAPQQAPTGPAAHMPAAPDANPTEPTRSPVTSVQVTLADLAEVWPDILEELQETDSAAWEAISRVQPLSLSDEVLTVGLSSDEDLMRFKTVGAGPLRDALDGALGIQVKYVPRKIPARAPGTPISGAGPGAHPTATTAPVSDPAEDPDPARAHAPAVVSDESDHPDRTNAGATEPSAPAPGFTHPSPASAPPQVDPLAQRLGAALGHHAARAPQTSTPTAPNKPVAQPSAHPAATASPETPLAQTPTGAPTRTQNVNDTPPTAPGTPEPAANSELPVPPMGRMLTEAEPPVDPYEHPPEDPYGDDYRQTAPAAPADPVAPAPATPAPVAPALANTAAQTNGPTESVATPPVPDAAQARTEPVPAPTASPTPDVTTEKASTPDPHATAGGEPVAAVLTETQVAAPKLISGPLASKPVHQTTSPSFVRYGEAVVREVLGARFIEERPLHPPTDETAR